MDCYKDRVQDKILIVNSSKINGNTLIDNFITEFDNKYNVIRNIKSNEINIKENLWIVLEPEIYVNNNK